MQKITSGDPAAIARTTAFQLTIPSTIYTVFAPTDAAFRDYFKERGTDKATFLSNTDRLNAVIDQHVALNPVALTVDDLESGSEGNALPTRYAGPFLLLGGDTGGGMELTAGNSTARVTEPNIGACYSILHGVDGVLSPVARR